MGDIFDQIATEGQPPAVTASAPPGDIFDQVADQGTGDIFDQVAEQPQKNLYLRTMDALADASGKVTDAITQGAQAAKEGAVIGWSELGKAASNIVGTAIVNPIDAAASAMGIHGVRQAYDNQFVTPHDQRIQQAQENLSDQAQGAGTAGQIGLGVAQGVGQLTTLPAQIMMGQALKAATVGEEIAGATPQIIEWSKGIVSQLPEAARQMIQSAPDFALGMAMQGYATDGIRGLLKGLSEGLAMHGAGEIGQGLGTPARVAVQAGAQGTVGAGMATTDAMSQGRLPTKQEVVTGAGTGAAMGGAFALAPGAMNVDHPQETSPAAPVEPGSSPPATPTAVPGARPSSIPDFIQQGAARVGEDPNYMAKVMGAESGGSNTAQNPNSSASGVFQFVDRTWSNLVNSPDGKAAGLTMDGRTDPNQQATAMAIFTKQNRAALTDSLGRPPTDQELYMAHFLGVGGAERFLSGLEENPNAPATQYVGGKEVASNRSVFFDKDGRPRTNQEVMDLMGGKVAGGSPGTISTGQTVATTRQVPVGDVFDQVAATHITGQEAPIPAAPDWAQSLLPDTGARSEELSALKDDIKSRNPEVSSYPEWTVQSVQDAASRGAGVPTDISREGQMASLRQDIQARDVQQRVADEQGIPQPVREADQLGQVQALPQGQGFEMPPQPVGPDPAAMSFGDLVRYADQLGVDSPKAMRKADLVDAVRQAQAEQMHTAVEAPGQDMRVQFRPGEQTPAQFPEVDELMAGPDARFSTQGTDLGFGPGLLPEQVQEAVGPLQDATPRAAPTRIIHSSEISPDMINAAVRSEFAQGRIITPDQARARIEGWTDKRTGEVNLVHDNLESPERASQVWQHEQVAHHGLHELFGDDPRFGRLLDNVAKDYSLPNRRSAEEHIAALAEKLDAGEVLRGKDAFHWQKITDYVRAWLAKTGISTSNENVQALLRQSLRNLAKGGEDGLSRAGDLAESPAFSAKQIFNDDRSIKVTLNRDDSGPITEKVFNDRKALRDYLQSIKPQEIRALKFDDPARYLDTLRGIVEKLFPDGADIRFRKQGKEYDYDHLLTDSTRKEYIHSLPETLKNEDIRVEFKSGDAEKAYYIKKYFDPRIQKDIWDMIVLHDEELRTKIARKGAKGRGSVEKVFEGAGNEASRSAMPPGDTENASTPSDPLRKEITPPASPGKPDGEDPSFSLRKPVLSDYQKNNMQLDPEKKDVKDRISEGASEAYRKLFDERQPIHDLAARSNDPEAIRQISNQTARMRGLGEIGEAILDRYGVSRFGEDGAAAAELTDGAKPFFKTLKPLAGNEEKYNDYNSWRTAKQEAVLESRRGKSDAEYKDDLNNLNQMMQQAPDADTRGQVREAIRATEAERDGRVSISDERLQAAKDEVARVEAKYGSKGMEEFQRIDQEHRAFDRSILDQAKAAGLISEETYKGIVNSPEADQYSSLARHFDEDERGGGPGGGKPGVLKAREGSERKVIPPAESSVVNAISMLKAVERNKLNSMVADLVNSNPDLGREIKLVKGGPQFAPKNSITVYNDGKAHVYEVKPEVATALKGLNPGEMNILQKMVAFPSKVAKWGNVFNWTLPVRHALRDVQTFTGTTKGFMPILSSAEGMFHVLKDSFGFPDEVMQKWRLSGGAMGVMQSLSREAVNARVMDVVRDPSIKYFSTPARALEFAAHSMLTPSRIGAFKATLRQPGMDVMDAMRQSREGGVDFARKGSDMHAANEMVPFLNMHMQGLDLTMRSFKNPMFWLKMGAAVTAPQVALWALYHDDDRYKALPGWEKDFFFHAWVGGQHIVFPKAFLAAQVFGTIPERILNWATTGESRDLAGIGAAVKNAVIPNMLPTIAAVPLEAKANYSFFMNKSIENKADEGLPPYMRGMDYSSQIAKDLAATQAMQQLSKWSGTSISPAMVDHFIRGFGGNLAAQLNSVADKALSPGDVPPVARPWAETAPFTSAIARRDAEGVSSSFAQQFYETKDELTQTANEQKAWADRDPARAEQLRQDNAKDLFFKPGADAVGKRIGDLRGQVAQITQAPDISSEDKAAQIKPLNQQIMAEAKAFNEAYKNNQPTPEISFLGWKARVEEQKAQVDDIAKAQGVPAAKQYIQANNLGQKLDLIEGMQRELSEAQKLEDAANDPDAKLTDAQRVSNRNRAASQRNFAYQVFGARSAGWQ